MMMFLSFQQVVIFQEHHESWWVKADFGQSNFGQSILGQFWPANLGQSIFGQSIFVCCVVLWLVFVLQIVWCCCGSCGVCCLFIVVFVVRVGGLDHPPSAGPPKISFFFRLPPPIRSFCL